MACTLPSVGYIYILFNIFINVFNAIKALKLKKSTITFLKASMTQHCDNTTVRRYPLWAHEPLSLTLGLEVEVVFWQHQLFHYTV